MEDTKERTVEELEGQKKTFTTLMSVIGALLILYAAYVIYSITVGTWDSSKVLSIVPFMGLTVVFVVMAGRRGAVSKEIADRK